VRNRGGEKVRREDGGFKEDLKRKWREIEIMRVWGGI